MRPGGGRVGDVTWLVPSGDSWPSFDIDHEETLSSLDQLGQYWQGAMESLAATEVPKAVRSE
jgi:hypothetical protein